MNWFRKFMTGRYGVDQLSNLILILSIILMIIGGTGKIQLLSYIGMALLLYNYYRVFSKDLNRRYQENMVYLRYTNNVRSKVNGLKNRLKQSRTHKFFKCPSCSKQLKVPKGKGKINITCPHCKEKFEARS